MYDFAFGKMDESVDPNDYEVPSLTPSSSMDRFSSSAAPSNHDFDFTFPFNMSFSDTISPSSLELFHTSHDDTCIDKCVGAYDPQGLPRGAYAPPVPSRPRLNTSSVSYYPVPDNNLFPPMNQQFSQMVPDFFDDSSLKYGQNHHTKSSHSLSNNNMRMGNHFNAADLGVNSKRAAPDDCVSVNCSKFSCSTECCSTQVCQEEACSGDGTPCDDLHCFEHLDQPLDQMWDLQQTWNTPMHPEVNSALHNQCNHTNTEHDVAITLRDLSAPGACNVQQQPSFPQFECPIFNAADYPAGPGRALSAPLEHRNLACASENHLIPVHMREPLKESNGEAKHTCQWIISGAESESQETVCGRAFNDSCSLQKHLCDDHISLLSSKTKYLCLWKGCSRRDDQVFASRNKLRRHIATHTSYKPHKCDICGEGFSAQQALDQHVRTHTGEKPYKCDVEGCNKSFKQKSALTMHKRTHTGEKPLQCEICGKCFCESSNLSKHRKTHNPDFKFKCEEPGCDSQFIRIDQLRRHQARHERQRKKLKARTQITPVSSASPDTLTG
ncbi:hypothetical protein F5B20DRAFT_486968 [Whalleya microplaca]|nr:hypothetical protein F5B20DRAFT_486968 [Whalleya microplaca]